MVSTDRDDDALRWGDDDPTLDAGGGLPSGFVAVGKGSEAISPAPTARKGAAPADQGRASPDSERTQGEASSLSARSVPSGGTSSTALVILGVFGGVYLLASVGWIIGGLRLQPYAEFLVAPGAYQVSLWLAVLAPLVWFATTLVLTRGGRVWIRVLVLLAGALLVLPWPFIMVGAIGQ